MGVRERTGYLFLSVSALGGVSVVPAPMDQTRPRSLGSWALITALLLLFLQP